MTLPYDLLEKGTDKAPSSSVTAIQSALSFLPATLKRRREPNAQKENVRKHSISALFLSPVLPTKNMHLNRRAMELNSLIMPDFVCNNPKGEGLRMLNFQPFVSETGVLKFGVWDTKRESATIGEMLYILAERE